MTDETLFSDALAIPDAADRAAFLVRTCPDPEQRQRVAELLAAVGGTNPLDRPAVDLGKTGAYSPETVDREPTAAVGDRVGPYKLQEKIGEGGMGEVWVADQLEPLKRRVALKLIKPGMDSRSVLGRFEAERQALAVMDHPNIAKVLDAGTTADGRPYFVMELVKGTPITEFCDARKLTPKQRLELFVPVCQAIQHAHMKGIIHRDIKPSNVLVALHDETPVPKVIDFGVAKAVGQQLTEKTIYTGFGALVGTPAYMAPEQATFNQLDVDTRADVYALGVLLYELLAGSPPIEKERLKLAALDEVLRIVRDEEPPRPSARLSTSQAKASIAATRGLEPDKLSALMKGEIDWIVMKALEKDRTRRYDSANGFAADVQRYLSGEQVQAVPPSLGYRLRKAYRKQRAAVLVAMAFAVLLIVGVAVASLFAVQARRAEAVADANANEMYSALVTADVALQQTEVSVLSRRIDADLAEVGRNTQPHVGLLRLARTLRSIPVGATHRRYQLSNGTEIALQPSDAYLSTLKQFREFLTAAILVAGQEFAPLLPPITHNGHAIRRIEIRADGTQLLTLGADGTARLWDMRTGAQVANLRAGQETVVDCGFSPDGRTIFTDDHDMTVRLWDPPTGQCRARTEPFNGRSRFPKAKHVTRTVSMSDTRLLTRATYQDEKNGHFVTNVRDSTVELWDTATGRRVARVPLDAHPLESVQFLGPRWLWAPHGPDTLLIWSAEDGREVARKRYKDREIPLRSVLGDGGGKYVLVNHADSGYVVLSTTDWEVRRFKYLSNMWEAREILENGAVLTWDYRDALACGVEPHGAAPSSGPVKGFWSSFPCVDGLVIVESYPDGIKLFDTTTGKQLRPPTGRRYHPELRRIAPDGRFVNGLDLLTEKRIPTKSRWEPNPVVSYRQFSRGQVVGHLMGYGQVAVEMDYTASVRVLPPADRLDIPPEDLELWLQVCLCGRLVDEEFLPWDEPTWQKTRAQLAAVPSRDLPVPFPGQIIRDRRHWLRSHYLANSQERDHDLLNNDSLLILDMLYPKDDNGARLKREHSDEDVRWEAELRKHFREDAPAPRPLK